MKFKIFMLILTALFSFNACDILRLSLFEVTSWSPGGGYHAEPEKIEVSLNFSHDPNRESVERNFSLTGNGNPVKGNFYWSGKKVIFSPLTPLENNTDYILSLTANANNTEGLSMDEAFNCEFTTRPGNMRPVLVSYSPSLYEEVSDPRAEIKLEFSVPVPIKTLQDNVSFSPSMSGLWALHNEGKLAVFTPSEPWVQNSKYEIRFSASLSDNNGMNIGNDFLSIFSTKTDYELPYLLYARRITKEGELIQLMRGNGYTSGMSSAGNAQPAAENENWEKEDRLSLVFSEPVDSAIVKNYLSAEDAPNLVMLTAPGFYEEFIFKFESAPVYESRFTLKIRPGIKDIAGNESKEEYIYRIFANGKNSKPPVLIGLRMPMAPENEIDKELVYFGTDSLFKIIPISDGNYPSGENVSSWIELYFSCAENASVDLFSLMELFRIDTSNNVINFLPRHMKTNNFTVTEPQSGWEEYQRIEITGNLINSTYFGIVIFQISAGLKDSFGNVNEKTQKITLIK